MRVSRLTGWWAALALLAAIRIAIPVAAFLAGRSRLPGIPAFVRTRQEGGLTGDSTAFYAASREFIASWDRIPRPLLALAALLLVTGGVAGYRAWQRRDDLHPWLLAGAIWAVALLLCLNIHWMHPSGAAGLGWPFVWGAAMLPYRLVTSGLGKHVAWDFAFGLSLMFVALTVAAVAYLGRYATNRRSVGIVAAAFWTCWPVLVGVIAGHGAWTNSQWNVDVGLNAYDEPLSTLLVTSGAALLLSPRLTQLRLVLGGCILGLATATKVSNALVAAIGLGVVYLRAGRRNALPYLAGALAFAPVFLLYWPKSYPKLVADNKTTLGSAFGQHYLVSSWTHSSIFDPRTLAIITPLAAIGALWLRRPWPLAVVLALLLVNPIFYSFFAYTAKHPRFIYASLPELFVLWAAGALGLIRVAYARPWARASGQ
jgi:hypothetical protein